MDATSPMFEEIMYLQQPRKAVRIVSKDILHAPLLIQTQQKSAKIY